VANWTDSLGADIRLPGGGQPLPTTASGDLQLVRGRNTVRQAMRRRMGTVPGTLVHRPSFGAGLPAMVEVQSTPGDRAQLAAVMRQQAREDSRVGAASASVAAGTPDDARALGVTASLSYQLARAPEGERETLTLAVAE